MTNLNYAAYDYITDLGLVPKRNKNQSSIKFWKIIYQTPPLPKKKSTFSIFLSIQVEAFKPGPERANIDELVNTLDDPTERRHHLSIQLRRPMTPFRVHKHPFQIFHKYIKQR